MSEAFYFIVNCSSHLLLNFFNALFVLMLFFSMFRINFSSYIITFISGLVFMHLAWYIFFFAIKQSRFMKCMGLSTILLVNILIGLRHGLRILLIAKYLVIAIHSHLVTSHSTNKCNTVVFFRRSRIRMIVLAQVPCETAYHFRK